MRIVKLYKDMNRIEKLKERTRRCVCRYCGSHLEIRRIIFSEYEDARVEIFCPNCDRIEFGVEPEIYQSAEHFVEELQFNCYPEFEENEQTRKMSIAKVCEIMSWENKQMGFLDETGFQVPIKMNSAIVGETLLLDDQELENLEAERDGDCH